MSLLTQALKQAAKRADDMEKGVMAIPSAPETAGIEALNVKIGDFDPRFDKRVREQER